MKVQYFELKPGESLSIGGSVITAQSKTGQRLRFKVESDEPTHKGADLARPQAQPAPPLLPRPGTTPD